MTNAEKARLRRIMKNFPNSWSDADAADECGCTVATARKYRRIFAKSETKEG
jgi:hypothetical protein